MTRRPPADLNIVDAFYRRWAPHEDKRREIADDHKEMFAEAKSEGLNPKALRKAFAEQYRVENQTADQAEKRNADDGDVELYLSALARVREGDTEYDAETGEVTSSETTNGGHDESRSAAEPAVNIPGRRRHANGGEAHDAAAAENTNGAAAPQVTNPGVDDVAPPPAHAPEQPGIDHGSVSTPDAGGADASNIHEPATIPTAVPLPAEVAVAGDGDSTDSSPDAVPGATNVTPFRTHNPATHFLNSKGLPRLHGCLKAEACGGSARSLCYTCGRHAEQASHQGGAA